MSGQALFLRASPPRRHEGLEGLASLLRLLIQFLQESGNALGKTDIYVSRAHGKPFMRDRVRSSRYFRIANRYCQGVVGMRAGPPIDVEMRSKQSCIQPPPHCKNKNVLHRVIQYLLIEFLRFWHKPLCDSGEINRVRCLRRVENLIRPGGSRV